MAKAESRNLHQRLEALNARVKDASLRGASQKEPKENNEDIRPWIWRWKDLNWQERRIDLPQFTL